MFNVCVVTVFVFVSRYVSAHAYDKCSLYKYFQSVKICRQVLVHSLHTSLWSSAYTSGERLHRSRTSCCRFSCCTPQSGMLRSWQKSAYHIWCRVALPTVLYNRDTRKRTGGMCGEMSDRNMQVTPRAPPSKNLTESTVLDYYCAGPPCLLASFDLLLPFSWPGEYGTCWGEMVALSEHVQYAQWSCHHPKSRLPTAGGPELSSW